MDPEKCLYNLIDSQPVCTLYTMSSRPVTTFKVPEGLIDPEPGTPAAAAKNSLRHPIYVHSKLMIVDDDYIILGSANINQRSMSGSRY